MVVRLEVVALVRETDEVSIWELMLLVLVLTLDPSDRVRFNPDQVKSLARRVDLEVA